MLKVRYTEATSTDKNHNNEWLESNNNKDDTEGNKQ